MPFPLSATDEARLLEGRKADAILVDLYTVETGPADEVIRLWNQAFDLNYPANDSIDGVSSVTYTGFYGRMQIDREVRFQASLAVDPLKITFDAAAAGDDDDPIGKFTDNDWHQMRIRVRQIMLDPDTGESPVDPVWEWVGRMDFRQYIRQGDEATKLILTSEGGTFRIRGRRMHTRTHSDQQRRLSGDLFFRETPNAVGRQLVWAKETSQLPTVRSGGGGGSWNWAGKQVEK